MSIVSRYVVKEAAVHSAAGVVAVVGVFLVTRLGSFLNDPEIASLPGGAVAQLLGLRTVMALPSLLPAVLYLGILLGISRLARDNELTAIEACGISPRRLEAAVLGFAAAAAVVIAALSFVGRPWAAARFNDVRDQALTAVGLEHVIPGVLYELDRAQNEVLFAESRSVENPQYLENVFVHRRTSDGLTVFSARRAIEQRDPDAGFRFLTLLDGTQYDLAVTGTHQHITHFQALTLRSPIAGIEPDLRQERVRSMLELLRSPALRDRAEVQWRAAMPVSAFLLALLALPLSRVDPRHGRYANVLPAVVLYVLYRQFLGTAKNWVADGDMPVWPGLWGVHLACLLVALCLMAPWRPANWTSLGRRRGRG